MLTTSLADSSSAAPAAGERTGKVLHDVTRPFAQDLVGRSWWHLGSTYALLIGALVLAALVPWWPVRLAFSLLGALLMVRSFILYHDFMHGAILRHSWLARAIFYVYASLALVPPRSWRHSHNFHHANVGTIGGSGTGSFPLMTTDMWANATASQRMAYRINRHPVTILFAYLTMFLLNVTLMPFIRNPKKHWDSAFALLAHGGLIALLWLFGGFDVAFFAVLLPMLIAGALGGYLFFAQHNFKGMHVLAPQEWDYFRGALESASYMKLGPIMRWFTGNIGYHHIHHLNPHIPFYRLPEAMAAIPELQRPIVTTLRPRDILSCLRLSLWDPAKQRMVTYREAAC